MRRTIQTAQTVVIGNAGPSVSGRVIASRKGLSGFAGTVTPQVRVAGSDDAWVNTEYVDERDGTEIAAGTAMSDQVPYSIDASGKEVAFVVAGTMGSGVELNTNPLMG